MLHIINQSPFESTILQSCLRLLAPSDAIILIEDGVLAALANTALSPLITSILQSNAIYALKPDLEARGLIDKLLAGIQLIDYEGFVDLAASHNPIQSWT